MKLSYNMGISTKLIFVVTAIIVAAIGGVIYIATDLYLEESTNRIQVNNKDSALHSSQKIQKSIEDLVQQMKLMGQVLQDNGMESEQSRNTIFRILSGFDTFLSFSIYKSLPGKEPSLIYSSSLETALREFKLTERQLSELPQEYIFKKSSIGDINLLPSGKYLRRPIVTLTFYSKKIGASEERWLFRSDLRQSFLLQGLPENKEIMSYVINKEGEVLSHSEEQVRYKALSGLFFTNKPIVQNLMTSQLSNQLMEYQDEGELFLGAYRKMDLGGLGIIAQVPKKKALATIEQVQYRSTLVMIVVVCLAFFINFLFSKSLTQPLQNLYQATEKIVDGDFDIRLKKSSSDELGALTLAFNDMASGLKEREQIKTAFNKFHSKEVAQKILSGEIKLGGEKKLVTVLFSDIRGFTAMSETMSPDQVVQLLNEYLTGMVEIISKWNGIVDKFIGDAIMAVWGAPEGHPNDAYNAARAAIEMREYMRKWSEHRRALGKDSLEIGIGIHSGEVLAGNIGSDERLEYTCIGDNVNQSSRIEAATKALKTDILISDTTYALIQAKGIGCGPTVEIQAKGKSEPIKVHQVIGYHNEEGKMVSVLSPEEIQNINQQQTEVVSFSEEKTSVVDPAVMVDEYYVVTNKESGEREGPYSLEQIKAKLGQGDYHPESTYIFKEGDEQMLALSDFAGTDRRNSEKKEIEAPSPSEEVQGSAFSNEWYISGPGGESLGPYSIEELKDSLEKGNIQRTTYVWRTGLDNWIYLHEIPDFDRRVS